MDRVGWVSKLTVGTILVIALAVVFEPVFTGEDEGMASGQIVRTIGVEEVRPGEAPTESTLSRVEPATAGTESNRSTGALTAESPADDSSSSDEASVDDGWPLLVVVVVDEEGRPLADATVNVEGRGRRAVGGSREVATHDPRIERDRVPMDVEGRVELPINADAPGELLLRAEAPGYVPTTRLVSRTQAEESITLTLHPGAFVTGRILDSDGEPVLTASYRLVPTSLDFDNQRSRSLLCDRDGRFVVLVESQGRCTFGAWNKDHGRSELYELSIRPGAEHDLGAIALLGNGQIGGRLLLRDGTPLTGVSVSATLAGEPQGIGLHSGRSKADESGAFLIERLAAGRYELSYGWDPSLLLDDPGPYLTGSTELELFVNVHQVRVEARNDDEQLVLLETLDYSWQGESGTSSARQSFGEAVESEEVSIPAGVDVRLAARGADGARYRGVVPEEWLSGAHELVLRNAVDSLATLVITATSDALPKNANLTVKDFSGGSGEAAAGVAGRVAIASSDGELELSFDGLEPGSYEVELDLRTDGYLGLADNGYTVELVAGRTTGLELELVVGGRLAIELESSIELDGTRPGAKTFVLMPGESEWGLLTLETKSYEEDGVLSGWTTGGEAFFDDEPGISRSFSPGVYSIRVVHEDHLPYEQTVEIRVGETTHISVQPTPK